MNLLPGDVTDVSDVKPWNSWCEMDYCKICGKGPYETSFEFHYRVNGGEDIYISEGCRACTYALMKRDPFYCSREEWQKCVAAGKNTYAVYRNYGLIDDFDLFPPL